MDIREGFVGAIGNTPLIRLNKASELTGCEILGKAEFLNPGQSVKDRAALWIIRDAIARGTLRPGGTIVEGTAGNTGIGLAMVAAVKGYKLIVTMPEDMSLARRDLLARYGAQVVLTPAIEGMTGAVYAAQELVGQPQHIMLQQFENPANPEIHRQTTAVEILEATEGRIDAFVAGVGTGGTITGVGQVIKKRKASFETIAVEPEASPVLSGGSPGPHKIQGIGAGFIPEVMDRSLLSGVMTVSNEDAIAMALRLAREEGILCGISSGANVWAAIEYAKRSGNENKLIVTIVCDFGERYIQTALFEACRYEGSDDIDQSD